MVSDVPSGTITPSVDRISENATKIAGLKAREVLDSRGNPTVEADVWTVGGFKGRASVPSGASTGVHEALELRDNDVKVFGGKGVMKAISNIRAVILPKITGYDCSNQAEIDRIMIQADGTENKMNLGANAILAVSMAVARAAAEAKKRPLYFHLNPKTRYRLPVPMMNVINGGKHAGNNLAIQEFLIEPIGARSFSEALRFGDEVYQKLKIVLKKKYGASSVNVGDEGGYAPPLNNTDQALDAILQAISESGIDEKDVKLGIDAASSSFFDVKSSTYTLDGKKLSAAELHDYYKNIATTYPILTIEDPFSEDDFENSAEITRSLGDKTKIIGDDLYVTNPERIRRGISTRATNSILVKLNQIGSVSETLDAIKISKDAGFDIIVSHRSGETEDTFISHLSTAVESQFIKAGAPARGERTAKYNELLRIEEGLGSNAQFAGQSFR